MTSGRDEYRTPRPLFDALNAEFRFAHDLAASPDNTLVERFSGGPCAGPGCSTCGLHEPLRIPRGYAVWSNPPYSKLGPWLERFAAIGQVVPVVALLPLAATSSWWWKVLTPTAHELRFPRDRVDFIHDPECDCKACATGENGSNRGENVVAIWLPYRRCGGVASVWGWTW